MRKNLSVLVSVLIFLVTNGFCSQNEEEEFKKSETQKIVLKDSEMISENPLDTLCTLVKNKLGSNTPHLQNLKSLNQTLVKRELKNIGSKYFNHKDKELSEIGSWATDLFYKFDQLPRDHFQKSALVYFSTLFPNSKIIFTDKKGGDQLGNRLTIHFPDNHSLLYHAKTHRGGLKSDHSSSVQPVDLKELLAYKILEYSGLGVETHFFYDTLSDFYIATLDAGYDAKTSKQKEFLTYESLRNTKIDCSKETCITDGFVKTDLLSRLLLISDVLNNYGNIGVINEGETLSDFRIIDFNPPITHEYENPKSYEDWLSGNNQYNYSDPLVYDLLKNRAKDLKRTDALTLHKNWLKYFPVWVDDGYFSLQDTLVKLNVPQSMLIDLKTYLSAVKKNHLYLVDKLL